MCINKCSQCSTTDCSDTFAMLSRSCGFAYDHDCGHDSKGSHCCLENAEFKFGEFDLPTNTTCF